MPTRMPILTPILPHPSSLPAHPPSPLRPGLEYELRASLRERCLTRRSEGVDELVAQLAQRIVVGPLNWSPDWYNTDENLSWALDQMLEAKAGYAGEKPAMHVHSRREVAPSISDDQSMNTPRSDGPTAGCVGPCGVAHVASCSLSIALSC